MFSKFELFFLDQANSSSDPSQISILQFPIASASLPPSPSLSNFALATWNPLQHNPHHLLHQFLYFVLPHWTTNYYRYWIYQTICKAKLMKVIIKLYTCHNSLWTKHTTHQKRWVFKSHFSFKVRQHDQQQLYLQYKICWILYKMVRFPSFSQPYLSTQPTLLSPPRTVPLLQSISTFLFHPYLFKSKSLKSPLTSPSSIPQQIFTSLFLRIAIPTIHIKNIFPTSTISPI